MFYLIRQSVISDIVIDRLCACYSFPRNKRALQICVSTKCSAEQELSIMLKLLKLCNEVKFLPVPDKKTKWPPGLVSDNWS